MPTRTVTVASSVGLHARPATIFSKAASSAGIPITITGSSGRSVNAASILGVLSLGVKNGEAVTLASDAPSSDQVLDELAALLATDLDSNPVLG